MASRSSVKKPSQSKNEHYVYHDVGGQPYLLVKRYCKNNKKCFAQFHWDGQGWKSGLPKGFKRIPFRLPEILKSRRVAVVEGERDVHTAIDSGLESNLDAVFTTCPQGAGKWPKGWGYEYFTGKDVVIIPDNDPAGFDHARQVHQDLQPAARSLGILQLPDLPAKGDLTDFLQGGGSVRTVKELVQQVLDQPEQFGPEHLPEKLLDKHGWTDADRARSYLAVIPNTDLHYDDYLRIGMALRSVDDSLLPDWIAWSLQSSKHVDGECERKWSSFNPNGEVTIATLGGLAKQHGWTNSFKEQRNGHRQNSYNKEGKHKETTPKPKPQVTDDDPNADHSEPGEQHRPAIQLDPGKLNSILSEIESKLSLEVVPRDAIYVQGNHDGCYLSRVLRAVRDNRSQLIEISRDIDTLDLLATESLQYELNRRFGFERYDARKEDYKPVDCPRIVASQFLQKGRWQLPRLTGISYIPLLCKDGAVIKPAGIPQAYRDIAAI